MDLKKLNKHFDPLRCIGSLITEQEVAILLSNKTGSRLWATEAVFIEQEAISFIGKQYAPFNEIATYQGYIIAGSEEEAVGIAKWRPFNEKVTGLFLTDSIPFDEPDYRHNLN